MPLWKRKRAAAYRKLMNWIIKMRRITLKKKGERVIRSFEDWEG
jgi:hypothetical protein